MVNYFIRRVGISLVLLVFISATSFFIIQLPPGDFATTYRAFLVQTAHMTQDKADAMTQLYREQNGLDKPMYVQYFIWIKGIITEGKFGYSFAYRKDAGEIILDRLPKTLMLALCAHAISSLIGIFAGIYVAPRQYGWADNIMAVIAFILTSIPRFFIALVLMFLLVHVFKQNDVSSFFSVNYAVAPWSLGKFLDLLKHIWPVILIAGLGGVSRNMRVMRANLLDVLNAQYVTTARSKGLLERRVMNQHAVPNALHPIIGYQGTVLPYLIEGELEAAIIFGIPSLGPILLTALRSQDIYLSGGALLMTAALIIGGNLLADMLLAVLDPRIRYS
jgi:peptide/nickel transport system permease protein